MIYNTTHTNEDYELDVVENLGKSFSLLKRFKLNGIGSSRMMISELSPKLKPNKIQFSEIDYGNIELRPKGILVHFTNRLDRYAWIIPYHKLVIYNSAFFSIHADGNFIKFRKNKQYLDNKRFISKMIDLKNKYLNLGYYDY